MLETIERGLPATVNYEIELWRSRSSWFDALEASRFLSYRVSYDIIEGRYECAIGARVRRFDSLEALKNSLLKRTGIRVADMADLDGGKSYYFSIRAKVILVELEQVREVEAWLDGKIPGEKEEGGAGAILGVPEKLFGFLAGIAGFGDEQIETRSVSFVPEGLE